MFLATTANQFYWKKDEKILFLGEWCKLYDQKHIWQNLDHEILPYHWENREKVHQDFLYCESLYEKLLKQLSGRLNQIHGVDHSTRYWRIIIGHWLFCFVSVVYDRYLSVKAAIDSRLVTNTWLPPFKPGSLICADYVTFHNRFFSDDNYNLLVFGEIARKLKGFSFETKSEPLQLEQLDQEKTFQPASFPRKSITKLLRFYSKCVSGCSHDIVFANSYLTRVDLVRLQLSLGQVPYLSIPQISFDQPPPNFKIRDSLKSPLVDNEFESLLDDMLVELIPTCYVEGYADINQNHLETFPKSPKVIFSANFRDNEGLKFWIGSNVEKGAKLVMNQHGGGYGVFLWSSFESHEVKISDQYLTWGWENNSPTAVPFTSGTLSYFKGKVKPDPKGSILWLAMSNPRYARPHISFTLGPQMPTYLHEQERFSQAVSEKVHELLLLRLYLYNYGWSEYKLWGDIDPTLKRYQGSQPFFQQLNESRLCICTYNATGFLQTFAANFPTILFWDPNQNELRESAQPYFDDLRRVGILHDTPESAAEKVNEVYEDPMSWWSSLEIQEAKTAFCHRFARTSDKWLLQWKEKLLKIRGTKKSYHR